MFTLNPSLPALICLSLLLLFIIIQLVYPFAYYLKLIKHPKQVLLEQNWQAVSIIVCARSEFQNLQTLIPTLLALDYPEFEVIIVDDASWDGSTRYLEELQKTEPRLKAVFVTEDMKKQYVGKKLALSLGLKAAKNEIILLCDADCLPASDQWIKYMVQAYHTNPNIEIVLGYSPFNKSPNFINLVARMENTYTGLSYFSYALNADPYMGVGRNLSYKRALFFKNKGFASHLHIAPGDDDLFINEVANNSNTAICCHPDAFVMTNAKLSFGEWFQQKKRHNFAGKYYKRSHQLKLGFFAFSHAMLWFALCANLIFLSSFGWALSMLGLYWLIKWPLMFYAFKKLKQTGLVVWVPIFDFLYLIYNVCFGFITLFGKQRKW
jgi:glycosyltransferase involved in cell wall biosynthesis